MSPKSVGGIGALDYRGELRVPHPCLLAGGADGTWADAYLDNISAGEDKLLTHLTGDDVAGDDNMLRESCAGPADARDEELRVSVRNVQADERDLGVSAQDDLELRSGGGVELAKCQIIMYLSIDRNYLLTFSKSESLLPAEAATYSKVDSFAAANSPHCSGV
jgi:hypothetical protein